MITTTQVADALVSYLRGLNLAEDTTYVRRRSVIEKREDLVEDETLVTILPIGPTAEAVAVEIIEKTLDIRMVVQRPLDERGTDGEAVDEAAQLAEQIVAILPGLRLLGAECRKAAATPSYDAQKMRQLQIYDGTIRTTWVVDEDQ
jgi:hypothetical protein